ncbi:hypothetical protein BGZ96_003849 [Linnemannia gamsii]|uniref:Uncharacterized protein n=1 Tax=Linnemannia gamsii TaxID=64522 RepID=A0ABQ7JIT0_9FUNG|nr:hypothetical protein BGZ96_003849 [Linnemannia gamsii]
MTRQHSGYSQLLDDCSSSICSTTSCSSSSPLISQPNTSPTSPTSTPSATNKPKVTVQIRNIAVTPLLTSPTRANVLESLVPLSVNNVMPRIIISPKNSVSTSPTSPVVTGAKDEGEQGQKNAKN